MDDNVSVLEGIGNPTDETLSSLGGCIDRDETEGTFGTGHFGLLSEIKMRCNVRFEYGCECSVLFLQKRWLFGMSCLPPDIPTIHRGDSLVFYRHPHNALLGGRNIPVLASLLA